MTSPKQSISFRLLAWVSLAALAACGTKGDAKSPEASGASAEAAPAGDVAGNEAGSPDAHAAAVGPTTTTTEVGGDDRGAKLESSDRRREDILAVVQAHRDEVRACYDKSVKDHPGIEGTLDVTWTIDPQGTVTHVSIDATKSQIALGGLDRCVIHVLKKIQFPPSAKGFETTMHYPFNFRPRKVPAGMDAGQ